MRFSVSLVVLAATLAGCGSGASKDRSAGQTSFESAPPNGTNGQAAGAGDAAGDAAPPASAPPADPAGATTRTVEETDLYRLEGNRLYYLNAYRGLMVFDVTNPDRPTLLGRSPIFGQPVDMIVRNGVAIVVIGDWFGVMDDGSPFHGSIVRGLDATDPKNIRVLGEAKLGGWVRDDRVVGDVIYAVSEDFGWWYGWDTLAPGGGIGGAVAPRESVIVSSVSFANGTIQQVDELRFDGFQGVFNVTPSSIMLASSGNSVQTSLLYLDISDPAGAIVKRGAFDVSGRINGWGADNGRWNLDFADGKTAHVIAQGADYNGGYVLSTVDFTNPDAPALQSALAIANTGWSAAARFDTDRLYLSPLGNYFWDGTNTTPFQVYDLSNPVAPKLAGVVNVPGVVWNILPAPGSKMFALGSSNQTPTQGEQIALQYLDISDPSAPRLVGTASFGQGWAWTPAAGTFKAFTMDAENGLVVLPFSGWDYNSQTYNNGLQLIEFGATSVATAGSARTKGWVERGIFVGNRLMSLSPLALSAIDYTDRAAPRVMSELTLARNVVASQPSGQVIAEVSSDWWGNDASSSEVRVLPVSNAEETADDGTGATVNITGTNARVFTNGRYTYVITGVPTQAPCPAGGGTCAARTEQVQVVEVVNGAPVLRGKIELPIDGWAWYGWGWEGFWWYDWWWGAGTVQVGGDVLAFRRNQARYNAGGQYVDEISRLYVVDLANPDEPRISSVVVQDDSRAWWGNMKVVGDTLYTTHYEWVDDPGERYGWVRYYLDSIDLGDRAHPRIGGRVNVPGLLVGGNASDPSIIYTVDYRWEGDHAVNDFDVLQIRGSRARLISQLPIDGWVGSTFVNGDQAYLSAQRASYDGRTAPVVELHAIDLSNPSRPRDRVASEHGWGWLLSVVGDRALVTSGWWGADVVDVYRLPTGKAPQFEQTVRTRGWSINSVSRQDQTLFLSSGYWGVQKVSLQ